MKAGRRYFPVRPATSSTERVRKLRARRRRAGLCQQCGLIPRAEGSTQCHACLSDARANYYERRGARLAAGLCTCCGAVPAPDGFDWCDGCREAERDQYRERKEGVG